MTALMLRYVEGQEEVAYQYARALVRRLTADLSTHDALRLARDIVTEVTNDIEIFEDEESWHRGTWPSWPASAWGASRGGWTPSTSCSTACPAAGPGSR